MGREKIVKNNRSVISWTFNLR